MARVWMSGACAMRGSRGKGVGLVLRGSTGPGVLRDAEGLRVALATDGVMGGLEAACAPGDGAGVTARRLDLAAWLTRSAGELGVVGA